jgi:hypothetical protein
MNRCGGETKKLESDLNGLGEQIAFKRADLASLLASQDEFKQSIRASELAGRVEAGRKEAVELIKRRLFIKAQIELSGCLKMLADIDNDKVDIATLQENIAETKKVRHTCVRVLFIIFTRCSPTPFQTSVAGTSF